MITITPGDPNYDWVDPATHEAKYPWDLWLDNNPHVITQFTDFDSELSTMIPTLRKKAKARGLKVKLAKGFDSQSNTIISFVSYPADQKHAPTIPLPRYQVIGTKRLDSFHMSEGLHGAPIIRDNDDRAYSAEDQLTNINKAKELTGEAPYDPPRCKYCDAHLSSNAIDQGQGECFRYGKFTHQEDTNDG